MAPTFALAAVAVAVFAATWTCIPELSDPAPLEFPPLRPLPVLGTVNTTRLVVERLFQDDPAGFRGPESLVFNADGSLYTGLADGRIVRVSGLGGGVQPTYETVARTGRAVEGCGQLRMESVCGRPLGLQAEGNGSLLVADAYLGLLRVDPLTGTVDVLVDSMAEGLTLVNDLEWDSSRRVVYFTHSGRFPRNQIHRNLIEARPTGSVYKFDVDERRLSMLVSGLVLPNGLSQTSDGSSLLVCSTATSSLYSIALDAAGNAAGEARVVQSDLQGMPDNIRRRGGGSDTFLVGLGSKRAAPFSLVQSLAPYLTLRRVMSIFGVEISTALIPKVCIVVEVDRNGQVVHFYQDLDVRAEWISEAEIHDGYMYLGSWRTPYLARARMVSEAH